MAEELKPAYLLTGSDRPKVERALGRLRARFEPESVDALSAVDASADEAVAACNALGLFGGARLVVVDGVERWKADDAKTIAAYVADPAPGAVLALLATELRKDSALMKAVAKAGDVLVYDVERKKIADWLAQQLAAAGARADRDFCRTLLDAVVPEGQEPDLHHLGNEAAKLATAAAGDELRWETVRELVVPFGDVPAYALTDAWGRRDVAGALAAAEATFEREAAPRRELAPRLVYALLRHLARVQECRRLVAEGLSTQEVASRLRRHPYYVQKLVQQAESFSEDELRGVTVRLARLDHALKGGSRLAGDLELERALVDVTRRDDSGARAASSEH